jgi:adenylate kinase
MMNAFTYNANVDSSRGIERWENEGGRFLVGTTGSSRLNRRPEADDSMREVFTEDHNSWPDTTDRVLCRSKVRGRKRRAAVLLGPPGSGKTSLVRSQVGVDGISVIETGNLLKREVRLQSSLGRRIKPYTDSGALAPSVLVNQVVFAEVESAQGELVLFDGFPRCADQIKLFFQLLDKLHLDLCAILVLTLNLQTAIKRLSGRRICSKCGNLHNVHSKPPKCAGKCDRCGSKLVEREDDRAEVIQERFESYEQETTPVIEFFRVRFKQFIWEGSPTASLDELIESAGHRLKRACGIRTSAFLKGV